MSTKTTKLSTKNKQLIQKFNNMRQFTITREALIGLLEIIEIYDCIRSTFPSIDIEGYLSKTFSKHDQEYMAHAKLLLGIYIHEEYRDIIHRPFSTSTYYNEVIITIDANKMQSIEPRLFENGRIESLIEQEVLQEVTFISLTSKEVEDLTYILGFVKRGYYEENGNYGNLNNYLS